MPSINKKHFKAIKENADFIANLMTIGGYSVSIATFSFAAITGITLASQEQLIYLPLINIPLGKEYQIALWIGGLLVYLEVLVRGWKDLIESQDQSLSFPDFIVYELLFLKRPSLLIPLPFVLAWGYNIFKRDSSAKVIFSMVLAISAFTAIVILFKCGIVAPQVERDTVRFNQVLQGELRKWYFRIGKILEREGLVSTEKLLYHNGLNGNDFHKNLEVNYFLIVNKALEYYHEKHEFEQDLMLTKTRIKNEGQEFDVLILKRGS